MTDNPQLPELAAVFFNKVLAFYRLQHISFNLKKRAAARGFTPMTAFIIYAFKKPHPPTKQSFARHFGFVPS
ncbi:MAG: hypothetical protein PUE78_03320, partial [Clostridia bacterium]|nr:hypothetical protein [Clostridia bacterium]